jgi:hypothetical protein
MGCVFVMAACSKERYTSWDIDVLAPLVETSLTIDDLIADSLLDSKPGTPLHIKFSKTLSLFPSDSIFRIPDTTFTESYSLPLPVNLPAGFQIFNINDLIRFDYGNTRITEAILEEGISILSLRNFVPEKLFFDYSIEQAFLEGSSLNYNGVSADAGASNNATVVSRTTDFKGYWLNLKGDNGNQFNRLRIRLNARLNSQGQGVTVPGNQTLISYSNSFKGLKPYFAKGYLGNPVFQSFDTINFSFLRKFDGYLEPEQIHLGITVENGLGADFGLDIEEFSAFNSKKGTRVALQHALTENRQNIGRARNIPLNPYPYTSTNTNYSIQSNNSNINQLISMLPDKFYYRARIQVNPLGDISSGNDFIYSSSNIRIKIEGDIPLRISANSLRFTDTLETKGFDVPELEQLQSGIFSIVAENGFPFEMQVEFILLDENKQFLRSFLGSDLIAAAPVNAENIVTTSAQSIIEVPYQHLIREQLKNSRYIVLKAGVTTLPTNTFLPVYPDYKLKLRLAGKGIYQVQIR